MTWKGDGVLNQWDVKSSANWYNSGPPIVNPDVFCTNDNVLFDDSTANKTVYIYNPATLYVRPASITVNTAGTYTFNWYNITGSTGITKSGTGTLILANGQSGYVNDYTGATTINAGTLQVGNNTSYTTIGTGPIVNNAKLVFYQIDNNNVRQHDFRVRQSGAKGSGILTLSGPTPMTA